MSAIRRTATLNVEELSQVVDQIMSQDESGPKLVYIERDQPKALLITREDANQFLTQLSKPELSNGYSISFFSEPMHNLGSVRNYLSNKPIAMKFIDKFASGDNYLSMTLSSGEARSVEKIGEIVFFLHGKSPMSEQGLDRLASAVTYAKEYGILPKLGDALHNMFNFRFNSTELGRTLDFGEIFDTKYRNRRPGKADISTRYLNANDLAAFTLMQVALTDYEQQLKTHPYSRLQFLKDVPVELESVKRRIQEKRFFVQHSPDAVPNEGSAFFDHALNRIVAGKDFFERDFFELHEATGISMAQMFIHEITHATSRFNGHTLSRSVKLEETYAHVTDFLYGVSRLGIAHMERWHNAQDTTYLSGADNKRAVANVKLFTGIDIKSVIPPEAADFHRFILRAVKDVLRKVEDGQAPEDISIDLGPIAESYALVRSTLNFISHFTSSENISKWVTKDGGGVFRLAFVVRQGDNFSAKPVIVSTSSVEGRKQLKRGVDESLNHMRDLSVLAKQASSNEDKVKYQAQFYALSPHVESLLRVILASAHTLNEHIDTVLEARPELTEEQVASNRLMKDTTEYFTQKVLPFYKSRFDLGFHSTEEIHSHSIK